VDTVSVEQTKPDKPDLPTPPLQLKSTEIVGRKRQNQSTHDMDDEDEEYDSTKEDSKGKLLIHMVRPFPFQSHAPRSLTPHPHPQSRIKAIAKQDPDVGGLSHGAVAAIST